MSETFDIEQRWPDLFESLTAVQRADVVNTIASGWHEGWEPNRDEVENLIDSVAGRVTDVEFVARARLIAAQSIDAPQGV